MSNTVLPKPTSHASAVPFPQSSPFSTTSHRAFSAPPGTTPSIPSKVAVCRPADRPPLAELVQSRSQRTGTAQTSTSASTTISCTPSKQLSSLGPENDRARTAFNTPEATAVPTRRSCLTTTLYKQRPPRSPTKRRHKETDRRAVDWDTVMSGCLLLEMRSSCLG